MYVESSYSFLDGSGNIERESREKCYYLFALRLYAGGVGNYTLRESSPYTTYVYIYVCDSFRAIPFRILS